MDEYGVLDSSYHTKRKKDKSLKYRLYRRTQEILISVKRYYPGTPDSFIDLGTADGLMLSMIKDSFLSAKCVGLEYSQELLTANTDSRVIVLQGDVNSLPLSSDLFNIAVATAIIEHLPEPDKMLKEAKRVLKPNGLLIMTSPDPFWEKVATIVGHLQKEQHHRVMNLKALVSLVENAGFEVLEQKKFMLSPIGMPLEIHIENIIRKIGLDFLFANQLIVCKNIVN